MKNKVIKVGFDLDGVLLYNPARIARPVIYFLKKYLLKRKTDQFYYPKNRLEQIIWLLLHKTSLFPQLGINEIKQLIKEKKIKAYVISARYESLKEDFNYWKKTIDPENLFSGWYYNEKNQQPYDFKTQMIKKLNLDVFVEDNWDIVKKLKVKNQKLKVKTKIFWICNLLDRNIKYQYKFASLKSIIESIEKNFLYRKKKVLIITDYFFPHWTGISKSIYNLTKFLKTIDFAILTTKYKNDLSKEEKINNNTTIYRLPYIFRFSRLHYSPFIFLKMIKIINDFDVVFINSPCSNILFASIITKIFNKKLIIFHQGDLILTKGLINRLIEKIFDVFTLISFALSDKISTYTYDYAINSRVIKPFINKFTPIILPINISKKINKQNNVYKKLNKLKKENKIIFGFGGRFVEEKGFDILFKAVPIVVKKLPNAHFVFAGETKINYEKTFEKLKKEIKSLGNHITFLGLLNENQLNIFFNLIDFVVIPSRSDCFPIFQAEAMLCGNPSIVANIPGARYLVKKTGFGLVFEKENPNDLAEKIIQAIKQKNNILKNYKELLKILDKKKCEKNIKRFFNL